MVRSVHWREMAAAGARLAVALPIGFPLSRPLKGRVDMRNHRKIVVIDNRITFCGSNNCADAAFAIKPRFAPWVDAISASKARSSSRTSTSSPPTGWRTPATT